MVSGRFPSTASPNTAVPGGTPVSEALADRVLSLPMHPHLDRETQDRILPWSRQSIRSARRRRAERPMATMAPVANNKEARDWWAMLGLNQRPLPCEGNSAPHETDYRMTGVIRVVS